MESEDRRNILSAVDRVSTKLSRADRRALAVLDNDLDSGEEVIRLALGMLQTSAIQHKGVLVLTDRRLLFIHSGMIQSHQVSVPLDTVSAVLVSKGLLQSTIKTTGPQSNVVVNRVDKTDAEAFASELRLILANRSIGMTQAPGRSTSHIAEELERLASLRDRGVLTEQEFTVQKSKLLGT